MERTNCAWALTLIVVLLLGFSTPSSPESSGKDAELVQSVGQALQRGNKLEALEELNKIVVRIWSACPLVAEKSLLVSEKASGYGMYQPRADNVYKAGEHVLLYVQPVGYVHKKIDKLYQFGLTADFKLLDKSGAVLGGQNNFGNWVMVSREPNTEFFMNLTYTFTGIKPGDYVVETVLKDKFSDKTTTIRTPIVIQK